MRASYLTSEFVTIVDMSGRRLTCGAMNVVLRTLRTERDIEAGLYVAKFDDGDVWYVSLLPIASTGVFRVASLEAPPRRTRAQSDAPVMPFQTPRRHRVRTSDLFGVIERTVA